MRRVPGVRPMPRVPRSTAASLLLMGFAAAVSLAVARSLQQADVLGRTWIVLLIWLAAAGCALHRPVHALTALLIASPFYSYLRREYLFVLPPPGGAESYLDPIHAIPDVLLILALLAALRTNYTFRALEHSSDYVRIGKAAAFFIAISALQILNPYMASPWKGMLGFREQAFFILVFFLPARLFRSIDDVGRVLVVALVTGLIVAAYAFKQAALGFTQSELAWAKGFSALYFTASGVYRVFSTLNSHGHLADFMMVCIFLGLAALRFRLSPYVKMLALVGIPSFAVVMAMTFVRSTWFGTLGGLVFFFFVAGARTPTQRIRRLLSLIAILVVVFAWGGGEGGTQQGGSKTGYLDAFLEHRQQIRKPLQHESFQGRMAQLRVAIPWILTHPLGGGIEPLGKYDRSYGPVVENYFVATAVGHGWLGLVAIVWLYVAVFRCGLRMLSATRSEELRTVCAATLSIFVGAVIASVAGPHPSVHPIDIYLWVLAGIVAILPRFEESASQGFSGSSDSQAQAVVQPDTLGGR